MEVLGEEALTNTVNRVKTFILTASSLLYTQTNSCQAGIIAYSGI